MTEEKKTGSPIAMEVILLMLMNVRKTHYIGSIADDSDFSRYINYVLDKGLMERTPTGNFLLTIKGYQLLDGQIEWAHL